MFRRSSPERTRLVWCFVALGLSALLPDETLAERATPSEMDAVCRNWLSSVVHRQGGWAGAVDPSIQEVRDLRADGIVVARCYAISPRGHVVVPVLKELPPIKVYSENCGLDPDEPDGSARLLREVLGRYVRQYIQTYGSLDATSSRGEPSPFGAAHRRQWDRLGVDPSAFSIGLDEQAQRPRAEVGPLLTTNWHQREPYNGQCPMGDGGICKVGCMATAVAQIMRYHQWPPSGIGAKAYYWWGDDSCEGSTQGDWLSADFSDPYDWGNMPDDCEPPSCTEEQEAALAELNYEVGVALEMDYGYCGSGPMDSDLATIMHAYFRYAASIVRERRMDHSVESWFALIQGEINSGRPIAYYFQVYENGIGHAVVCDGWSDEAGEYRYHINYGWGGSYTAWYAIDEIYNTYDPMVELMDLQIMPGTGYLFRVRPDGLGDYATIQAGIDHVLSGDIIELVSGTYTGSGNRDISFRGKAITVRSEGLDPAICTVDCGGGPDEHRGFLFVSGEGPGSVLEGVTITGGHIAGGGRGGGILCGAGTSPTIRNCVVRNSYASGGGGGISCSGSAPLVQDCVLSQNVTDGTGGAIMIADNAQPSVNGCTIFGNTSEEGGGAGIWISSASTITVENSIIAWGAGGAAVDCDAGSGAPALACCDLYGNAGGDWVGNIADQLGSNGNISADPLFCDQAGGDFHILPESPCSPDANPACGLIGAVPVGCRHHLVLPDGTGDFPTIQAAIDAAGESDFIELADGVYRGDGNRDLDFGGRRITVRSQNGNPDSCVIDCEGSAADPHRGFRFTSGEIANSRLDGIAIVKGYMRGYSGGAIWCGDGTSPSITNCVFRHNESEASGGGVWCSKGARPTLAYCGFFENRAVNGGALFTHRSDPVVRNCTFVGNAADVDGACVASASTDLTIVNSILAFNTGSPPVCCYEGSVTFGCCDIYGNEAGDWIGCAAGQNGTNGNISLDPVFCDSPDGDYRLGDISPCAPFSAENPTCDLVGAYPVGCAIASVDEGGARGAPPYLEPCRPNPSASATRIIYRLGAGGRGKETVHLSIFDAAGRLVRTLIDGDVAIGVNDVIWDGRDGRGRKVPAGAYFIRLLAGGVKQTRGIVLVH